MASRQPFPPNPRPKTSILFLALTISTSLIILSAILYFLYYLWYSLVPRSRTSPFDGASPLKQLQRFSYKELKNATSSFSSSNCIGKGGSCTVFRGILRDGKLVAVKLLDSASFQCEQEFQNELKILGGLKSSPFVVSLLGFCVEGENRLVVYEYMPNRSLQESLFSDSDDLSCGGTNLSWGRRFSIILDITKALAFLHIECEPAVIHGDVKPSNVLLDAEFRAKLSDFGLSRLRVEGEGENEIGVDLLSQDLLWKSQELSGNSNAGVGGGENESTPPLGTPPHESDEVDFALALQASASSKNSCKVYHNVMGLAVNSLNFNFSPDCGSEIKGGDSKGKELSPGENGGVEWSKFVPFDDELSSVDHSKELNLNAAFVSEDGIRGKEGAKQWGKDWWWRQDGSGEFCSKDYVMEWIGSQICPSTNSEWDEEKGAVEEKSSLNHPKEMDRCEEVSEDPVREQRFEFGNGGGEKGDSKRWRVCNRKHRKMHEWWKEEQMDEVRKKRKRLKRLKVPHFGLGKCFVITTRRKSRRGEDQDPNDQNMEFSIRKGWRKRKKKNSPSMGSEDLFSRELSSTTSMRGTLCYVAPEYNGYGYGFSMEKTDIYSLGVLILVIISGRRPLHVLSSPMKLEKANLISWCRSLAHCGNTLELVDQRLKDEYSKEQASLCINLALACLQKVPELRPDIGDIVKILNGDMELPSLPFEFSPSPPPKLRSRSRRRLKNCID